MHLSPAHLLQGGLLPGHHLDHPVAAQVHRRIAFDHHHHVAERRDVGPAGCARPEQRAHLRDRAGGLDLVVEDLPGAAATGEQVDLVGDPGAGRVHQVDHRDSGGVGPLDDPDDLLDGPGSPRAGLDRRVVGHQADPPSVDGRGPGDDAVRGQTHGERIGELAVLDERSVVDESAHPLPGEQLALRRIRLVIARRATAGDAGAQRGPVVGGRGRWGRVGVGAHRFWSHLDSLTCQIGRTAHRRSRAP